MVESKDILAIVKILRNVTTIVKLCPFVLSISYIVLIVGYMSCGEAVSTLLDQIFYTSPLVVAMNLILSRVLKLCKWHRLECSLPLFPLIPLIIDHIWPISRLGAIVNSGTILLLLICTLINAYFVFIKTK